MGADFEKIAAIKRTPNKMTDGFDEEMKQFDEEMKTWRAKFHEERSKYTEEITFSFGWREGKYRGEVKNGKPAEIFFPFSSQ